MGYSIEERDGIFEVRLYGEISKFEILMVIAELCRKDPGKKHPDLWIIAAEVQIPYAYFKGISEAISFAFAQPPVSRRSAVVAADAFQKAQLELYRQEASSLPLEIRVFLSYEEAVAWVKSPEVPATTRICQA